MNILITLVFAINIICSIQLFNGLVEADQIVFTEEKNADGAEQNWSVDTSAISRVKRHSTQSRISLIEPERPEKKEIDYDSQQSRPKGEGFSLNGYELDNQAAPAGAESVPTEAAAKTITTAAPMTTVGSTAGPQTSEPEGNEEIISPLVVYVIIAGIILTTIALLLIAIAVLFIICTIPSCDKEEEDEEEEDPCAMPKGKPSNIDRTPASFSRCPSFSQKTDDDRRYSEQSEDLVHKSRGFSLGRQSSCRICPRFAPKSTRGRASCASTMTSSSGGSDDAAAVAATTAGKKDYFVACVCDLPGEEENSPSVSTSTTFGRC